MGLFDKFKKKEENPDVEELLNLMSGAASSLAGKGCDTDEIPEGIGEFGLEITNPIPVNGIPENEIYLSRLKTSDGDSTAGNDTIRVQFTSTSDSSTDATMEYQIEILV